MDGVSIDEARAYLPRLIARVEAGEEILLRRGDRPVAKLVPIAPAPRLRRPGALRGRVLLAADFDAPLGDFEAHGVDRRGS